MDDRRARIVRAAADILDEGGVEAMTMRRLAERIGFTAPVIYEHFAGKEDVLAAVVDDALGELARVTEAAQVDVADPFTESAHAVLRWAGEHTAILAHMGLKAEAGGPGADATKEAMKATMRLLDPDMDERTMELRGELAWATILGIAAQVQRAALTVDAAEAMVDEAMAAYRQAWSN